MYNIGKRINNEEPAGKWHLKTKENTTIDLQALGTRKRVKIF